ncbi:HEPN domain-containing protein [Methanocella arvoryzae]|uniref:HEPN domain-containing protein n=1 Tax=Methanocella arvoryzae (strain DSM 22066 / NBRC 105507 / MRE50) TaxID=351160 RepID=Q0W214_METAR|nr:HEPN domain-containing protein [Methanocella arvoryzae]CAJ37579.1 hypothetical protein RCIX2512 [Methanocella arvoryzae MRE50]
MKPFQYYVDMEMVRQGSKDRNTANNILTRATKRLGFIRLQEINQDTAPFIFEDAYEVMRECVHALMITEGYKPFSHEATVAYLNDKRKEYFEEKLVRAFDRYRVIRNDIMYRANSTSMEETIKALEIADEFVRITRELLDKNKL